MNLKSKTVGIVVGPGFDDAQVVKTAQILRQRQARVIVISAAESEAVAIAGRQASLLKPDISLASLRADMVDALIIPGGDSVDRLKTDERVLTLLMEISMAEKPIGAISNGPLLLAAAGLVNGMRSTGIEAIKEELEKAGSRFLEQGVVVDHNLVMARTEDDIPHFVDAVSFLLEPAPSLR